MNLNKEIFTWRHAPQGLTKCSFISAQIAMLLKTFCPCEIALHIADLSAQIVKPYETFSTLHPSIISPSPHNNAAPTEKLLYGQYAFSRTSFALFTICFSEASER
jgi:hypothetical protein